MTRKSQITSVSISVCVFVAASIGLTVLITKSFLTFIIQIISAL